MKYNRRIKIIIGACLITAVILTVFLYNVLKNSVVPEKEILIPVFAADLSQDSDIIENQIKMISVKESVVPPAAIRNKDEIIGKQLLEAVNTGSYVFLTQLSERGVTRIKIDDMYVVGIDVENISDSLGLQLRVGDTYQAYSKIAGQEPVKIADTTIVALVNQTGRESANKEGSDSIKTINVAVKTEIEMKRLLMSELNKALELIKPPKK